MAAEEDSAVDEAAVEVEDEERLLVAETATIASLAGEVEVDTRMEGPMATVAVVAVMEEARPLQTAGGERTMLPALRKHF